MFKSLAPVLLLPLAIRECLAIVPAVQVDLQASFPTPPFLLELLESAAAENASSFFPLLTSISKQTRLQDLTDERLYTTVRQLLRDDGHLSDPHALASWDLAVATHASAPRIEAQYQQWRSISTSSRNSSPASTPAIEAICADVPLSLGERCKREASSSIPELGHVYGHRQSPTPLVLYADILAPSLAHELSQWSQKYHEIGFSLRYKPGQQTDRAPLTVSGYGVELALKRTDYIVIDDRASDDSKEQATRDDTSKEVELDEGDITDVQPLSSSELRNLGVNAASFIMSSDDQLETLAKVSQDFPKFSAALAKANATRAFLREHRANSETVFRPGLNALWLNGQQISSREIDAYTLLDTMRRERTFINRIKTQGLAPAEAVRLASHPALATAQSTDDVQRYDFRDDTEGGNVIVWLNDLEKDKRYIDWPDTVTAYLQRMFPGQLPTVRKNAQTAIFPVDLTDPQDILDVVDDLQNFVKRTVPVHFGIVPVVRDAATADHAKVLYHLYDSYGLAALMRYLKGLQSEAKADLARPSESAFSVITKGAKLRKGQEELSLNHVTVSEPLQLRSQAAMKYMQRLGSTDARPPMFANGAPIPRDEGWMQFLSQRLSMDLRVIQQAVFEETAGDTTWLPSLYLNGSSLYRDPLLIPEDDENVTLVNIAELFDQHRPAFAALQPLQSTSEENVQSKSIIVVADLNSKAGATQALHAAAFALSQQHLQFRLLHSAAESEDGAYLTTNGIAAMQDMLERDESLSPEHKQAIGTYLTEVLMKQAIAQKTDHRMHADLVQSFGLEPGQKAIVLNGRVIGPLHMDHMLTAHDLLVAVEYEQKKRFGPTLAALEDMELIAGLQDPLAAAKLSTMLALATTSDLPEGIYDNTPGPRTNALDNIQASETCIKIGDKDTATLHFAAVIDPSSDTAQRWIPVLKTLSELEGVHMRLFLNPRERLQELPTKRFYRYVLSSAPKFDAAGAVLPQAARFEKIPESTLLTMTMDVPPAWLVAPKESVHDLDNLRLSSLRDYNTVRATYELEKILIEGHSRDTTTGSPPRGAQLELRSSDTTEPTGTIVMANLGYFQFKANPGVYNLALKAGASDRIFTLNSAGAKGYAATPGDLSNGIALTSFKGATVFPRLSRRPGMELEDVLETESSSVSNLVHKGAEVADSILAKAGLPDVQAGDYIARGFKWGQDILGVTGMSQAGTTKQADINIFSVASGHLYERMLNIMMVSVMRNTNHTVKFWFIEQFLSPSFKAFLPSVAEEYGFSYEMVTYKWPHWLRSQQEKQRVIWGYKILFLDVLFPLDLDKVIFVDADQIVRTDMYDLVEHDLEGAPYGFTPMCDSRTEMEGFRFWKQGYWENFLRGKPYHISALYVVDLKRFRQIAAGDRLRQQYHSLSADPNSLSNLDQDLPNHMQHNLPIHSLPQEWLWCETWCSDESQQDARTIDLCNNPQTKEPKLDRARRQVPEWTVYDDEIAALARRSKAGGNGTIAGVVGGAQVGEQERLQRDAAASKKDEL